MKPRDATACLWLKAGESGKPLAVLQKGVGLCARVIYKPSYSAHASRDN